MSNISTYIEHPSNTELMKGYSFRTLILDLPFCSVRAHRPYDWSDKDINDLNALDFQDLAFNLDGIYTDHELSIIKTTIESRKLHQQFSAVRIQDPGLIIWINEHFPNLNIQLNSETGLQNTPAIKAMFNLGIQTFICNHETPASDTSNNVTLKTQNFNLKCLFKGRF